MKNIELKVRVDDFTEIISLLKNMEARQEEDLNQIDTYYDFPGARLKFRMINNEKWQLIYYSRPDTEESKLSDYKIVEFDESQYHAMKGMLQVMYEELVVVKKKRSLWLYKNTRVHLDSVESLGHYVELETVINDITAEQGAEEHKMVIEGLKLDRYQKIQNSYSDLLME